MKVSVITVTTTTSGLARTFASLKTQSRPPDEWIIKECGKGPDELKQFEATIKTAPFKVVAISQEDLGISDGLNQALEYAEGEIITMLHNGDEYHPDFLEVMCSDLRNLEVRYCNIIWTSMRRPIAKRRATKALPKQLWDMPRINHPTFVTTKSTYEAVGYYDLAYRIAMDFDWVHRALNNGTYFRHFDRYLYYMDATGTSHRNISQMKTECESIARKFSHFSKVQFEAHWFLRRIKLFAKSLLV